MAYKQIKRPQLTSAVRLTAREMNDIHFSHKRTVLTPAQLEKIAAQGNKGQDAAMA